MPAADADLREDSPDTSVPSRPLSRLPFPPVTRSHILHCSVHHWHPLYRSLTLKTRLIPLSPSFVSYLRADGIILPPETSPSANNISSSPSSEDEEDEDPSLEWSDIHSAITSTITELGGRVHPKLNWSAPKDATWIAATNSMECSSANDIYLLLKSSDFITHDLEQAFDGCEPALSSSILSSSSDDPEKPQIPYHLVLRKSVPSMITSMEFRCFVRGRRLLCACQRDLNHYDFLSSLVPTLQKMMVDFFDEKLKNTFPDDNFVFDVYIPRPKEGQRVWLIDINPWAPRTDPLLFSWMEILTTPNPPSVDDTSPQSSRVEHGVLYLSIHTGEVELPNADSNGAAEESKEDADESLPFSPELRLVGRDDPEAYSFNSPLYSAHKLPKDVVDASMGGQGGIRDFLSRWESRERDSEGRIIIEDDGN